MEIIVLDKFPWCIVLKEMWCDNIINISRSLKVQNCDVPDSTLITIIINYYTIYFNIIQGITYYCCIS